MEFLLGFAIGIITTLACLFGAAAFTLMKDNEKVMEKRWKDYMKTKSI